ncbi:preprotein translocase subunit SecG [Ereboglobus luteus]|uniref:Protein-export membrane protein SecG n=1 Tax=Ereboglobus luteus TaxID=1796921 RepID=A0A2U8E4I9_9BACT|nr:preprotein translocase subunit SecG [Ereboglobus luteus]AWI09787.1 preprotein translocase subunit SecG [Ereboglobus luteus]
MSILLTVGILVLVFVSIIVVLLVLMQRAKNDGGVGAAMGGGMAEATFGAETSNVLSKATIKGAVIFFVLAFALYLGYIYVANRGTSGVLAPEIAAPAAPVTSPQNTTVEATPAATPAGTPAPEAPAPAQQ